MSVAANVMPGDCTVSTRAVGWKYCRIFVSAATLLVAACSKPAPIRIAVVGGIESPNGAALAVQDVNAAGGINGRPLELSIVREGRAAAPREALATAESLAADPRVLAVIGHSGSGASLAASQVYNARHLTQIAPNSSTPLYAQAGPYSFRLVAGDEHQARFIADHVAAMSPATRVALLYVNDDYGRALRGALRAALDSAGRPVAYEAPVLEGAAFAAGANDLVQSVADVHPDLLIWIGLSDELTVLRPKLRSALPNLRVLGSDAMSGVEGATFTGDRFVSFVDLTADRPDIRRFASLYRARTGQIMPAGAPLAYDAVGIIAQALRAGASNRESVQRYLESSAATERVFQGIAGTIVFDANGDARPQYVLLEITHNGRRRVLP